MMGLGSTVHLSAVTVCMHQTQTQTQFQRFGHPSRLCGFLGFPYSESNNNLLLSPSTSPAWGIGLKSTPLSFSLSLMATHFQVSEGAPNEELGSSLSHAIGQHDLLIVGPGVLGRLVAEKWREVLLHFMSLVCLNVLYL